VLKDNNERKGRKVITQRAQWGGVGSSRSFARSY
jgi:hypothetical protein